MSVVFLKRCSVFLNNQVANFANRFFIPYDSTLIGRWLTLMIGSWAELIRKTRSIDKLGYLAR